MRKSEIMKQGEVERMQKANEFLGAIAGCGRKFFEHNGEVSRLELDTRGRVWFIDSYSKKRVYTHYRYNWRGFTNGGTLHSLIKRLRDFIKTGQTIPRAAFWHNPNLHPNGDYWGYGDAMATVQNAAIELGIVGNLEMDAGAGESDYPASITFTSSKFIVTAFGYDREHCEDVLQCVLLGRFNQ